MDLDKKKGMQVLDFNQNPMLNTLKFTHTINNKT
jgi:hypothetical protein